MNRRDFLKDGFLVAGSLIFTPSILWKPGNKYHGAEPNGDKIISLFYHECTDHPEQKEIEAFLLEQAALNFKRAEIVRVRYEYPFLYEYPDMWRCAGHLKVWGFTDKGRKELEERFLRMKGVET